jgi:beta-galactosidase
LLNGANVKISVILLFLIASVSSLVSQPLLLSRNSPELPKSYLSNLQNEQRNVINLNGEWSFTSDKTSSGKIQVPFCYDFKGKLSCSRTFSADTENPDDWNYVIFCDGINYQCEIKINGSFVVKHEGGFIPFTSLIGDGIIKSAGNVIEVAIDNTLNPSKTIPLKNTANYPKNYGGIYRDIYIIAVPKIFVKSASVFTEIDINLNADLKNTVTITGTDIAKYSDPEKKLTVKTELLDTGGTVKASSDAAGFTISSNSTIQITNKFTVISPLYWSPANPYQYKLKVTISQGEDIIDSYVTDFGIYELIRKPGAIVLNKSEFKFKGINYIEEFGGKGICAAYEDVERDVKNIKSLGCNIIKLYGRPASNYLIDVCNREGLLIMEEIPVFTAPAGILESENFIQLAENQITEMVTAHKNNPCIFAYGLGNDFDVTGTAGKNYVKNMVEAVKKIDDRFIYYSTRNYYNDKCRELVDLTGLNFYDGELSALKTISADLKIKKEKVFISNYGKVINPSNTSGYSDPYSIESQSKFIVDLYKLYKSSSFQGGFFQSYTDWNSDLPNLMSLDPTNRYMRTSGLYTLYREQRPPAIILRKEFLDEDIPNLNIGTFSKEAPLAFVFTGLITFILFIYLANSVRRFRENVWRALFRPFIFFTDVREQNLIPTIHNVLLAIILSIGNALFFANLLYFWKDSQLLDIMLAVIVSHDSVKIFTDQYMVNPVKLTGLLAVIMFIKIFIISFIIWLFSLTVKYRVGFNNIYTVTVWGLLPTVLLLAIGTFYIRILQSNTDFVIIGLAAAGFLYLLSLYRILKGTYLTFDIFFIKVYAYGIITIALIGGGLWFWLNSTKYLFDYFQLVMGFLKG